MNELLKKYVDSTAAWLVYGSIAVWVTLAYVLPEFPTSDLGAWGFLQYPVAFLSITIAAALALVADNLTNAIFQNAFGFAKSAGDNAVSLGTSVATDVATAVSDSKQEIETVINKLAKNK